MSRCTMPAACASASASATCAPIWATSTGGQRVGQRSSALATLREGKYSMTSHGSPASSATSCMAMAWMCDKLGGDPALAHGALADSLGLGRGQSGGGSDLLDRDFPVQQACRCEPDRAHATAAQLGPQAVSSRDQVVGADAPLDLLLLRHVRSG